VGIAAASGTVVYRRAVTTCLLNPKAYAFTLALFPAFIHSNVRSLFAQTLAMGLITVGTQIVVYGAVAAMAVRTRVVMQARQRAIARTMGSMLIVSALLTAAHAWVQT
jgi:threonine/homoserine/homoserine lactone efflux protein